MADSQESSTASNRTIAAAGLAIAVALLINSMVLAWGFARIKALTVLYNEAMIATLPDRAVQAEKVLPSPSGIALHVQLYSDFDCPFCRRSVPAVLAARRLFGDSVSWTYWYRANPRSSLSIRSALIGRCTDDGTGPWKLYSLLSDSTALTEARLTAVLGNLGQSPTVIEACAHADSTSQQLWRQMFLSSAAGRTRTPTVVVDGIEVAGMLTEEALEGLIRERLALRQASTAARQPKLGN